MSNKRIKIPKQLYIGLKSNYGSRLPSSIMTEYGIDNLSQDRIKNVDRQSQSEFKKSIIDNKPLAGFKLTSFINAGSYGYGDVWKIEDPRGFEVDIKAENLAKIMSYSTVRNGEILDSCIWGRRNGNNYLLPIGSPDYEHSIEFDNISSTKVSIRNISPGDKVILRNGRSGTYYGKLASLVLKSYHGDQLYNNRHISEKMHVILIEESNTNWKGQTKINKYLKFTNTIQPSSFVKGTKLSDNERRNLVNNLIIDKDISVEHPVYGILLCASIDANISHDLVIEEDDDTIDIFGTKNTRSSIISLKSGEVGRLSSYYHNGTAGKIQLVDPISFNDKKILIPKYELKILNRSTSIEEKTFNTQTDIDKTYSIYIKSVLSDGTVNMRLVRL